MFEAEEDVLQKGSRSGDLLFLQRGEVHATSSEGQELFDISAGSVLGDHVLLERASPLTFKAMTRCELLVLGDKGLAEQVKQHLGKPERTRLASDVVRETCRKMRLRYLTMRVALTRLRENKAQGTTRRTQAVLVIQAAQVRRLARPSAYSTTTFEERWGPIGSLHVGRKNSLPGSPTSSSPARSPQPARSQQPAAQCVPTSFAHAARAKLPPVKLPANMLANSFSKSQAAHFQGASAIPEGPPPLIRAPAAWPSAALRRACYQSMR